MVLSELIFDESISFDERASAVLSYQLETNPVYRVFFSTLKAGTSGDIDTNSIPLLPVRAFQECQLLCGGDAEVIFRSSGTSSMNRSRHFVFDLKLYRRSILRGFETFYPHDAVIWAYLPGYDENPDSSLIWMLKTLTGRDAGGLSRFLSPGEPLDPEELKRVQESGRPFMLFGAAFGLLDLVSHSPVTLPEGTIVIETGGMKTHKRQLTRVDLHNELSTGFHVPPEHIHSEYGMCELLSQAYSQGCNWFEPVPWMKVTVRDSEDPSHICPAGKEGKIGIVDLANLYSCPFILTEDKGVTDGEGRFQVLGRWRPSDMRGCNFLVDRD